MSFRLGLLSLLVAVPLTFAGQLASATPYTFNSTGSFSNCSGCTINSAGTEIGWGGDGSINSRNYDGSTITANPLTNQTGTTPATQDQIGQLTWDNESTSSDNTASTVTASYQLLLAFLLPNPGGNATDAFTLNVTNTPNNAEVCVFIFFCSNTGNVNDTTGFAGGSNTLTVDGLTLSNITLVASGDSTFNATTGIWSNPEDTTSTLKIYANISNAVTPVPEPGSLAILGTALAGLGLLRLRKNAARQV